MRIHPFSHTLVSLAGLLAGAMIWLGFSSSSAAPLEPARGILAGAFCDTAEYSPLAFNATCRVDHAFFTRFDAWPVNFTHLDAFFCAVSAARAAVHITVEPMDGISNLTAAALAAFAANLYSLVTAYDTPCFIRFAHEMNGSWYPWCMQPVAYSSCFARLAAEIHGLTATSIAMVWAPNNSDGYPYTPYLNINLAQYLTNTPYHGTAEDFARLDTNGNGVLDAGDDPYAPFYPGDAAVDWVGVTIYHWDNAYPYDTNEPPTPRKVTNILTGHDIPARNFYSRFAAARSKPLIIPETSAMYVEGFAGASDYTIKMTYMNQLYHWSADTSNALNLAAHFPLLKGIGWFNIRKQEGEVGNRWTDWRITNQTSLRTNYTALLRLPYQGARYARTALDMRGIVYGWNGWLNGWRALDPGCSISLATPAFEGTNALRLRYDGTGAKPAPNLAVNDDARLDAAWLEASMIQLKARVLTGAAATLELILQSNQTGWDTLGAQTVPADQQWHELTWTYEPNNHTNAAWFNVYFAAHLPQTNALVDVLVDQCQLAVPEPLAGVLISTLAMTLRAR